MSISLSNTYGDRANLPTTDFPFGSIKNRQSSTSRGTPLDEVFGQDFQGFLDSILVSSGKTPNGSTDTAINSQRFKALVELITGRLEIASATVSGSTITLGAGLSGQQTVDTLFDSLTIFFRVNYTTTASTSINAFGLGARNLRLSNGGTANGIDLSNGILVRYNAGAGRFEIPVIDSSLLVREINRNVLPSPTTDAAGIVREATSQEIANRSSVQAFARPSAIPRRASQQEVDNRSNVDRYVSPDQIPSQTALNQYRQSFTYSPSQTLSFNHGLGAEPHECFVEAVCIVADGGYQVGDVIRLYPHDGERNFYTYYRGAGQVRVQAGSDGIGIFASTGNYSGFTPTRFQYFLVARRFS